MPKEKGKWLLDIADLEIFDVDAEKAIKGNRQLQKPSPITEEYNRFMKSMKKYRRFSLAVAAAEPRKCLRQDIKTLLYKWKILRGGGVSNTYQITYQIDTEGQHAKQMS